jgi:hypothetical protein
MNVTLVVSFPVNEIMTPSIPGVGSGRLDLSPKFARIAKIPTKPIFWQTDDYGDPPNWVRALKVP